MKFPKNRANIYVVIREDKDFNKNIFNVSVVGVFPDAVEADNFKDACASEWFDKKANPFATFDVRLSTFYG